MLVTDDFTRTEADGWGTSTLGTDWTTVAEPDWVAYDADFSVDGSVGWIADALPLSGPPWYNDPTVVFDRPDLSLPFDMTVRVYMATPGPHVDWSIYLYVRDGSGYLTPYWGSVEFWHDIGGHQLYVACVHKGDSPHSSVEYTIPDGGWENRWWNVHLLVEPAMSFASVWPDGDPEPDDWQTYDAASSDLPDGDLALAFGVIGYGEGLRVGVDDLVIDGYTVEVGDPYQNFDADWGVVATGWGS